MADEEKKLIEGVKKLAKATNLKMVATGDVHYVMQADAQAQDAIVCIQTGKNISDIKRLRMIDSPTFYLKSAEEMNELFANNPDAITNTIEIAKNVHIEIPLGIVAF